MTSGSHNTHSILAPSAAKRWTSCTASVQYIKDNADKIPERESSKFAEEGTIAHDLAADILVGKITVDDIPNPEMKQAVGAYVRLAESLKQEGDTVFIEERVPLSHAKEDGGTVDFALVNDDRVYVLDLKYGAGVMVEAQDNPQLAIYALSLIEQLELVYNFHPDTLVTMTIFQPRTREGLPTKIWSIKLADLQKWAIHVSFAAKKIRKGENLCFKPSHDACQWCPAKGFCKDRKDHQTNSFSQEGVEAVGQFMNNEETELPTFDTLTDAQVSHIALQGEELIKYIRSIQADALERKMGGVEIEGLKVIQGKPGNRGWTSEEDAAKLLKPKLGASETFTKKIISIAQAEKKLKGETLTTRFKNRLVELTTRSQGKPKLAPASDPAPDISVKAEEAFDNNDAGDLLS